MAKISVSIGETLGNMTIPELKKYESLRLDVGVAELDSKELGIIIENEKDLDKLFEAAMDKCIKNLNAVVEKERQNLKERDIKKG